ncbi:MAG: adenosylcobinamide-GDP ribazoletransferase [Gomphosphaeria aponina SAG 52.96 = DSM 107014]|uniref:Adenosylcobinamide-GDP ribazoletransferase n=1 Tax=Gomphosphaeria aponina SAG 52.96 = DSM 107014 TaxID=1521640 RepID=A0A941GY10_9CHRO|nr:adenosylcobinamide-GDP ribazoletransferase [Gomphosphaeria aponina SAG 52.96 = DSM 107014]
MGNPVKSFLGAVTFYTTIRIPVSWELEFHRIARWAPLIGLLLGGVLTLLDLGLNQLGMPVLTRSIILVSVWIVLTGGLHLDGVMDTADGLAVTDESKRLEVMQDSLTGAFGVMAAVVLLLLKTASLSDIESFRWLGLMAAAGWGRFAQVMAIAFYPYLRENGKGAFHKQDFRSPQDIFLGLVFLFVLSLIQLLMDYESWWVALLLLFSGQAIAFFTGFWFHRQLGGHTGDTYGAVVEWTEAFFLCLLTLFF